MSFDYSVRKGPFRWFKEKELLLIALMSYREPCVLLGASAIKVDKL